MWKSPAAPHILRGILAIAVGIIAIAWPGVTVLALVILFAVYAFIDAGLQTMRAFALATAGPVIGHLMLALADLAAGVIALAWPGATALALVLIVGICAFAGGFAKIFGAFHAGETAGTRALLILAAHPRRTRLGHPRDRPVLPPRHRHRHHRPAVRLLHPDLRRVTR
jgi:uncharacterized membrane protein HdeD (DUF308 family)